MRGGTGLRASGRAARARVGVLSPLASERWRGASGRAFRLQRRHICQLRPLRQGRFHGSRLRHVRRRNEPLELRFEANACAGPALVRSTRVGHARNTITHYGSDESKDSISQRSGPQRAELASTSLDLPRLASGATCPQSSKTTRARAKDGHRRDSRGPGCAMLHRARIEGAAGHHTCSCSRTRQCGIACLTQQQHALTSCLLCVRRPWSESQRARRDCLEAEQTRNKAPGSRRRGRRGPHHLE